MKDWARLGSYLRESRDRLRDTQATLGARIGADRNTIRRIEQGKARRVTDTITKFAREVGWTAGSIEDVLAGGEPTSVAGQAGEGSGTEATRQDLLDRLPERVLQELTDGEVIDTDVLDLREDGSTAVLTLVVERGGTTASRDQVREDLKAWGQAQRKIRRILLEQQQEDQ
ncbi:helix-turn-helix transcriptional regulator [Streptomyces sp. MP131-18]|uniref:helix-turn-helix transcriptional regulator n=1 Tax=Streptomyces sp. MP131-18 TaxID=1857892 RepID=UPI001568BE95|nr:helix-turn-helix transcriptional regulator [Streptomyces sp. MP131-18]